MKTERIQRIVWNSSNKSLLSRTTVMKKGKGASGRTVWCLLWSSQQNMKFLWHFDHCICIHSRKVQCINDMHLLNAFALCKYVHHALQHSKVKEVYGKKKCWHKVLNNTNIINKNRYIFHTVGITWKLFLLNHCCLCEYAWNSDSVILLQLGYMLVINDCDYIMCSF
jgi:hypothetical protein